MTTKKEVNTNKNHSLYLISEMRQKEEKERIHREKEAIEKKKRKTKRKESR